MEIDKNFSKLMVSLVIVAVPITIFNEIFSVTALHLLKDVNYLKIFEPDQIKTLAMILLNMHEYGVIIAGIFWGLWLFPFGYLVIKSGFMPKILGILLIIGCFSYIIDSLIALLAPQYRDVVANILMLPLSVGELSMIFYLLIKGVKCQKLKN